MESGLNIGEEVKFLFTEATAGPYVDTGLNHL